MELFSFTHFSLFQINDPSYKLFFIAVILLETKAGKTISISFYLQFLIYDHF